MGRAARSRLRGSVTDGEPSGLDGGLPGARRELGDAVRGDRVTVPVVEVDLTDDEAKALNVALNNIGGEFDIPRLAKLIDPQVQRRTPRRQCGVNGQGTDPR